MSFLRFFAVVVLLWASPSLLAASSGYWRYAGYRVDPPADSLPKTGMPAKAISGALQVKPRASGSLSLKFTNEDAEKAHYVADLMFGFQIGAAIDTLRPGDKLPVRAQLSFGGNGKAASLPSEASGQVAVGLGDYLINLSDVRIGRPASAEGTIAVEGGGPGATMQIVVTAYIGSYGAFSGKMIIDYIWETGTPADAIPTSPTTGSGGWSLTPDGYPLIQGDWTELPGYPVRITQTGGSFTATCDYSYGQGHSASWRMDGTISRDGKIQARLVHTDGVPSTAVGYAQQRNLALSPDGRTLKGHASFPGGGHELEWRKGSPPPQGAPPPVPAPGTGWTLNQEGYPSIEGDWTELPGHTVHITQTGGTFTATCTYTFGQGQTASWRVDGTISRDGKVQGQLVHTSGVPSSAVGYAQQRQLTLSRDGRRLQGESTFSGGSHSVEWVRR